MAIDPAKICAERGYGAMCAFTREFTHPPDRTHYCSADARERFFKDGKRFPPGAYEHESLAWRGTQWRTYCSHERAQIMGWPYEALQEEISKAKGLGWCQTERRRNSWIGNGFHAPSIMVFLVMLVRVAQGMDIPSPRHGQDEIHLRSRIIGTVWEPGFRIPGVMDEQGLLHDIKPPPNMAGLTPVITACKRGRMPLKANGCPT